LSASPSTNPSGGPTLSASPSDCVLTPTVITDLDFFNSKVTNSSLSIEGGIIRYENIGTVGTRDVDLVVSLVEGTSPSKNDESNGKSSTGLFGQIQLNTTKGELKSGEGNFRFCFYDHDNGDSATVDSFRWSVYDIDSRNAAVDGIKEKMIIDITQAEDVILYPNEDESEVKLSCEDETPLPCDSGVRTVFHSSTKGTGPDNPSDPNELTEQQKKRSVVFTFKDTSCWEFTYNHYCRIEVETGEECRWYGGGNFLFSGAIIKEGECISSSPTVTPVSTEPSMFPSAAPSSVPSSVEPSDTPSYFPTLSALPSAGPSNVPSLSASPSTNPTSNPSLSAVPSTGPSNVPSLV
jgi:hypothetical protein